MPTISQTWGHFLWKDTFRCQNSRYISAHISVSRFRYSLCWEESPISSKYTIYCFGDVPCQSASHGLIINIYAFSKWNSCANKHWCFVLFFNISWVVCESWTVLWEVTQSSSAALSWNSGPWKAQKKNNHNHIVLMFPFHNHSPVPSGLQEEVL